MFSSSVITVLLHDLFTGLCCLINFFPLWMLSFTLSLSEKDGAIKEVNNNNCVNNYYEVVCALVIC